MAPLRHRSGDIAEIKSILVPTDGSAYSEEAVDAAVSVARQTGATVTAMYVMDVSSMASFRADLYTPVSEVMGRDAEEAVSFARCRCEADGVEVRTKVVAGRPADEIVEESRNHDLVVMNALGRSGTSRYLIGSVADKVVRAAHCPVLTIRNGRGPSHIISTGPPMAMP